MSELHRILYIKLEKNLRRSLK